MSDIRHHRSERIKPDCARAQRALYRIADFRALTSVECGRESVRGLCPAVVPRLRDEGGFTLLELVIVIGIIAILLVLVGPAFTTLTSGTDVSSAIYGVKVRPIRATTGKPIMPMALISSPSGNYRSMRICILCRSILGRGLPLRIRTLKWHDINQPVRRTF